MPCDPQCPMIGINVHLIDVTKEKIATIRQILGVTEELGRQPMIAPNRRNEVTRSVQQLSQKLVEAMTRLMHLTDEIVIGCATCRTN